MKIRLAFTAGLFATCLCAIAYSQTYQYFPGTVGDQRARQTQENVEELYVAGNFRRALLIYEKDLAPVGDKYAQYMVGYMHLNGEGTNHDATEALAWYRVAAERGEALLVEVRDQLAAQLTSDQVRQSDVRFLELWKSLGDRKIVLELIERDLRILRSQTGTRISGSSVNRPSLILRSNGQPLGPNFYVDVRKRLAARIQYLEARVDIVDDILSGEFEKTRTREAEFREELAAMENR